MFESAVSEINKVSLLMRCKYCDDPIDPYTNPGLLCEGECDRQIHINCLVPGRVPTALVGDVFFELLCKECSDEGEKVGRAKMSWFKIVVLTLYNLRERSNGISRRGYFHWKSDIVLFIDRNWDNLFKKHVKRKKNWVGTISGTLSHHSNTFFASGTTELGESGWWKLIDDDPPEILAARNDRMVAERKKPSKSEQDSLKIVLKSNNSPGPSESSLSVGEDSNFSLEASKHQTTSFRSQPYTQPTGILPDFLLTEEDLNEMENLDIEGAPDFGDPSKMYEASSFADLINNIKIEPESMDFSFNDISLDAFQGDKPDFNDQYEYSSDSRCSEDFPTKRYKSDSGKLVSVIKVEEENQDTEVYQEIYPSLFTISQKREWPWKKTAQEKVEEHCNPMSIPEENHLLKKIEKYKTRLNSAPPSIKRLYRKLVIRKWKRENNMPVLDVDTGQSKTQPEIKKSSVLDLFTGDNVLTFFEQRLQGYYEPTVIHSPYTNRVLRPFIRRDTESKPVWLNVMQELLEKTNKNNASWKPEPLASIDYSYVRPQHIPAMNSLCNQFFWPGIDLTECLQYPDFTCVVLYKKLVIGFAVMVPDVGINEAYISFILTRPEWRNAKIGTFMLYHLIQTCMGKDITLHVSASNPALFLYEKFGFKLNEFVHGFYDKYMSPSSRESRHALFLRLSR